MSVQAYLYSFVSEKTLRGLMHKRSFVLATCTFVLARKSDFKHFACVSSLWIAVDLSEPEPRISFIDDSPAVSGNDVEIHLATNYDVSSLECKLDTQDEAVDLEGDEEYRDCKNLFVELERSRLSLF